MAKQELDIFLHKQARTKFLMYFTPNSPRIKMESIYSEQDNEQCKQESQKVKEMGKDKMYERILKINNILSLSCSRKIVEMNGCSEQEKIKNIELIEYLVFQVSRLEETNAKLNQYRRKSDQFLMDREELLEKISKDQRSIELQKSNLILKKQNLQRSYKEMIEKFTAQRDQLQKQLKKIQARQKAYQAQFRKKDSQIKHLQDSIKKIQEKSQPKNHTFQIIERPSVHKSKQRQISAIDQYHQYSIKRVEQTIRQLIEQNKYFRESFVRFVEQLNKIFVNAKSKLNEIPFTDEEIPVEKLIIIKPEIFNLSMKQNRQKVQQLLQSLPILNQILVLSGKTIENNDKSERRFQFGEWKIKSLIENYNELITCQDQLINKIIPITQERPREHQSYEQERCNKALQNFEFDRIREIIFQQINQIERNNRSMGETKKKLIEDIRRTEQIKNQMEKQRSYLFQLSF